jgi:hypothetical protein
MFYSPRLDYQNHSHVNRYGARSFEGYSLAAGVGDVIRDIGRARRCCYDTSLGGRLIGVGLELHPSYLPYRETCDDTFTEKRVLIPVNLYQYRRCPVGKDLVTCEMHGR